MNVKRRVREKEIYKVKSKGNLMIKSLWIWILWNFAKCRVKNPVPVLISARHFYIVRIVTTCIQVTHKVYCVIRHYIDTFRLQLSTKQKKMYNLVCMNNHVFSLYLIYIDLLLQP